MSRFALPPSHTPFHPYDAYPPAPLLSNPSTDSSSSCDSAASAQIITPRGSISAPDAEPIHVRLPSDSSSITFRPSPADTGLGGKGKKSSRATLRPKASFSSWRSSFSNSASSVSLRLRPSQDSQDEREVLGEPGQFDDAHSSPSSRSIASLSKGHPMSRGGSTPMTPTQSTSSDGSSSDVNSKGSTKRLISSLKRLGMAIRSPSSDRRSPLHIQPAAVVPPPLSVHPVDAGPLQVSYSPKPASGSSGGSFAAYMLEEEARDLPSPEAVKASAPPTHRETLNPNDSAQDIGQMGRGLFSPGPPESPVVRAIEGTLSPISDLSLSLHTSPAKGPHPSSYPTPVLPSTACPSPLQSTAPTRTHLPSLSLVCHGLPSSTSPSPIKASPLSSGAEHSFPRSESSSSFRSNISHSESSHSVRSLNRLSTLSVGSANARNSNTARTSSGFRSGSNTPTSLTCTPIHTTRTGLPSTQSASSLSISSSGASGVRRASSLRSADRAPRGSPTGSPSGTISPAFTVTRRNSPIPPSLILTPKALVPPVHAVSPVIGVCPVEPVPAPDAPGRPRAKSGRWRSPTGMFELGGLGLGDLTGAIRSARVEEERKEREKYEHVDTPGEFGLGVEKEKEVEGKGENPYFS